MKPGRKVRGSVLIDSDGSGSRRSILGEPLGPADRFLLLVDRDLRRRGFTGFQAALAVELDGAFDDAMRNRLAAALAGIAADEPRARARLGRRAGIGPLRLLAPKRAIESSAPPLIDLDPSRADGSAIETVALERMALPLDPSREPLFDLALARGRDVTRLVLRWWHPAFDERGAELLIRALSRRFAGEPPAAPSALPSPTAGLPFRARHVASRRAIARLNRLTQAAPFELPAASSADAASTRGWQLDVERLDETTTRQFLAASDAHFGLRGEGLAQIAALFHALAEEAEHSSGGLVAATADKELSLPITVQLRPPRASGPLFANALLFLADAAKVGAARDRAGLAAALRSAAKRRIADGEEVDAAALLEFGRFLPLGRYQRELFRSDGSPRFSAHPSTLGEMFAGARELFGRPLLDALAFTAFPARPGLGVVFSRAAGRLRVATIHARGIVDSAAARRLHDRVVAELRLQAGATLSAP